MKRIICTSMLTVMMFSNICFANTKIDNDSYKSMINNSFGEMNLYMEDVKSGSLKELFIGDIDEGYIKVEKQKLEYMRSSFSGLRDNIENVKLEDSSVYNLHQELITQMDKISKSFDKGISNKDNLLSMDSRLGKIGSILLKDDSIVENIKRELQTLNTLLEKINNI